MLKDHLGTYYFDQNYNCAESLLRAANDYYQLGLHDRDMILCAAYGAGMQTGATCGALLAAAAVLSMKYVEAKAHESADIKPVVTMMTERFTKLLTSTQCHVVKPLFFQDGIRCLRTVEHACDILEQVIAEYDALESTPAN